MRVCVCVSVLQPHMRGGARDVCVCDTDAVEIYAKNALE